MRQREEIQAMLPPEGEAAQGPCEGDRAVHELPSEDYVYRRTDNGRQIVVSMTIAERLRREVAPGRILLEDGTPADRDFEAEAEVAPRGAIDREHAALLRSQLFEALGS